MADSIAGRSRRLNVRTTTRANDASWPAFACHQILGKVVANVGTFAVTEVVPGMIEVAGKQVEKGLAEKRSEMTPEQIEKAERVIQNGKDVAQRRK
jgi:hypothetical protein